jgi:hypothetical protein
MPRVDWIGKQENLICRKARKGKRKTWREQINLLGRCAEYHSGIVEVG